MSVAIQILSYKIEWKELDYVLFVIVTSTNQSIRRNLDSYNYQSKPTSIENKLVKIMEIDNIIK